MTADPDVYHHHPTLGSRMAETFSSFLQSQTRLNTVTPAPVRLCLIYQKTSTVPPPPKLHFYSPAKQEHADRRHPGIQPRRPQKLRQNMQLSKKVLSRRFFQQNREETH